MITMTNLIPKVYVTPPTSPMPAPGLYLRHSGIILIHGCLHKRHQFIVLLHECLHHLATLLRWAWLDDFIDRRRIFYVKFAEWQARIFDELFFEYYSKE